MTTNPYQIANLQELTEYYVYVKSNCGSLDGVSEWSSAYSFTTRCNPITNYPYRYNFDDDVHATFPICWSSLNSYNNYPNVQQGTYVVSPGSLHFISDGIKYQYALTPAIGSSMDALQVSFSLRPLWQNTSGTFEVGIMSDPNDTSTFELIKRIEPKREDVVNYEIPLIRSLTDGTNNHIAFRHLSGQILSQQGAFFLDDVIVDSLPPCIAPLDIQLLKLDSHEVIIGWESVKQESQWNIKVSATQLSDPSNTITGIMYNLTTNVDTFRMTNLSVGTTYYIYIQSVCQDDLSKWREFEVDIPCSEGISILPFIESFNGYETGESPNCWIKTAGNPVVNFGFNSTDALNSGSLYMFTSPGINTAIMTLPELNVSGLSVHDLQVSFSFIATGAGHAAILGVMTDPTDESTFEAIDTFYAEKSYEFYKVIDISLASYQGNGTFIAFKSQIGFGALYSNVIYIDDITIEQIPTCKRIIDININELSNDFASIEWTPRDNSSNWELVIGAIGFDPNDAVVIEVANPNHTFNNLTALTAYQVYIRTDCGNNDKSQWSLPINFVTTPIPTNLPWSTNFSDDNDNAL